jgi:hypothetical protein
MIEDMSLAGLALGTQKIYTQAVYRLAVHYRRSPDQLNEEEVRSYLLSLCQRGVARGTFKTGQYGLRFLYRHTLGRAPQPSPPVPADLSNTVVPSILASAQPAS